MAMELLVSAAELIAAANELNQANQIYEEAVEACKSTAADLASKWEGATKDAFVIHQENAYSWHKSIIQVIVQMVDIVRKAAEMYNQVQQTVTNIMKG